MNDKISRSDYGCTGIFIPASLYFSRLGMLEVLLLTDIRHLCSHRGCFKTNRAFAEFHDISERSVSRTVATLKNKKLIKVAIVDGRYRKLALTKKFNDVYNRVVVGDDTEEDPGHFGDHPRQNGEGYRQNGDTTRQNVHPRGGKKRVHAAKGEQLRSRAAARKDYTNITRKTYAGAAAPDPAPAPAFEPSVPDGAPAPDPAQVMLRFVNQWLALYPRVHSDKDGKPKPATVTGEDRTYALRFFSDNPHRTPNDLIGMAVGAWLQRTDDVNEKGRNLRWYCNEKAHRITTFFQFFQKIEDQMGWENTQEQNDRVMEKLNKRFPVVKACR
jgi:hypothetical protein